LAAFAQHGPSEWQSRRHKLTGDAVWAFGGAHRLGLHSARVSLLESLMKTFASTNATTYLRLQPDVATHPIPYFGDPGTAVIGTIGVNPSDGEFRGRGWPGTLDSAALEDRLTSYFKAETPQHPWFRGWERVLNLLGHSYIRDAVHLDLSPRATVRMSEADPALFRQMVAHDMNWFLSCLSTPEVSDDGRGSNKHLYFTILEAIFASGLLNSCWSNTAFFWSACRRSEVFHTSHS